MASSIEEESSLTRTEEMATATSLKPTTATTATKVTATNDSTTVTNTTTTNNNKRKRPDPRIGTKFTTYERHEWYKACVLYTTKCKQEVGGGDLKTKLSVSEFLKSNDTPIKYTESTAHTFRRRLREFRSGNFIPGETAKGRKRLRKGTYHEVEMKLVQYVKLRNKLHRHTTTTTTATTVVSWKLMKQQCEIWKQKLLPQYPKYQNFNISSGWIDNVLKRHELQSNNNVDGDDYANEDNVGGGGSDGSGIDENNNNKSKNNSNDNNNSTNLKIQSYFDAEEYINKLRMYAKKENIPIYALDSFEKELIKHELSRM